MKNLRAYQKKAENILLRENNREKSVFFISGMYYVKQRTNIDI